MVIVGDPYFQSCRDECYGCSDRDIYHAESESRSIFLIFCFANVGILASSVLSEVYFVDFRVVKSGRYIFQNI